MTTSTSTSLSAATVDEARAALDAHVRKIVRWHFSSETGTPYWLDWAGTADWDPVSEVQSSDDLLRFIVIPPFELRLIQQSVKIVFS